MSKLFFFAAAIGFLCIPLSIFDSFAFKRNAHDSDNYGQLFALAVGDNSTIVKVAVNTSSLLPGENNQNVVLFHDHGPCFWIAQGLQVHVRTGGEFIWCLSLIRLLLAVNTSVLVTNMSSTVTEVASEMRERGCNFAIISHWGWQDIALTSHKHKKNFAFQFVRPCLLKMNYWGTSVPTEVWPGAMKRYVSPFPLVHESVERDGHERDRTYGCPNESSTQINTATGFGDHFDQCSSNIVDADAKLKLLLIDKLNGKQISS